MAMMGIGGRLREAREARGVTLEQAERETRIIRRYLTALEDEEFGAFPAEVYARGFLRSYSAYLGLDPEDLLKAMPRTGGVDSVLEPRGATRRPAATPGGRAARSTRAAPERPGLRLGVWVAVGLLVAAVIGRLAGGAPDPALVPTGLRVEMPPDGAAAPTSGGAVAGRMPDLRGMDEHEALRRLAELGVTPFVIEVPSREVPAGRVIRQSPAPNAAIGASTVTVVISRGG